jgi:Fe-S-cluster containining protein
MSEGEWVTGNVTLRVQGEPLELQMTVPAFPVKPHRMLPIFQQMANTFVDASAKNAESMGEKISCKAGCGACCRQPVPISEAEVYQIAELVESMPEPRRSEIKKRFEAAAGHFHDIRWFERINEMQEAVKDEPPDSAYAKVMDVVLEYFHEGIPCPFLEDESCSIHANRPISCREYLVISPAENCKNPTAKAVKCLELLIKPSRTVRSLSSTGRMESEGLITLVRALEFAGKYPEKFEERTGEEWMREFFTRLTNSEVPGAESGPGSRIL